MTTITTEPKGLENVMLRVPPKLKEKMAATARNEKVSQNTLMTASLFLSTLAWGKLPVVGPPENILAFLDEVDRAAEEDDLAYGAFDLKDWAEVGDFAQTFLDYGFIRDLQHRTDTASSDTIAYRFYLTKLGASVLPMVTWMIRVLLECKKTETVQVHS